MNSENPLETKICFLALFLVEISSALKHAHNSSFAQKYSDLAT